MKRYNVYMNDGTVIKLYGAMEKLKAQFPEASKFIEDTDNSFVTYIEKIKESSVGIFFDYRGREIWKILHNNGYILYRQFIDEESFEFLDGCIYQRWDNIGTVYPVLKSVSTPKAFYELFVKPQTSEAVGGLIPVSINHLKSNHAKLIYNKEGMKFWIDENGLFYGAVKRWLPSRHQIEEYKIFANNMKAVLVSYGTEVAFRTTRWFCDFNSFLEEFRPLKEKNSSMYYVVQKYGYRKLHPNDRKVIVSFPNFALKKEIELAQTETANKNIVVDRVARTWIGKQNSQDVQDLVKKLISIYLS